MSDDVLVLCVKEIPNCLLPMFKLLDDIRIIDLTTIVLGPYATQLLADFGAEVIKVESDEGDVFRAVRPGRTDDVGVGFMNFNRNKRSDRKSVV